MTDLDQEALIALLRKCVELDPVKCRNTLKEALRMRDDAIIQAAKNAS